MSVGSVDLRRWRPADPCRRLAERGGEALARRCATGSRAAVGLEADDQGSKGCWIEHVGCLTFVSDRRLPTISWASRGSPSATTRVQHLAALD
jgi:hypothetical protein